MHDEIKTGFNRRDVIIYALGIGAADLRHTYENDDSFQPIPTILFSLTLKGDTNDTQSFPPPFFPQNEVPIRGPVLDAERYLELFRPLEASEQLKMRTSCLAVSRKGSGAIVQNETLFTDAAGNKVARVVSGIFYVGSTDVREHGVVQKFTRPVPEEHRPDLIAQEIVNQQLPAIYRLSGDYNPLHIDPDVAAPLGFTRPIMHGLCSLGFAVRIVIKEFLHNDASLVKRVACRFSKPAYPGSVLRIEMWKNGDDCVSFRVVDHDSGTVVVDQAYVEFQAALKSSKL